jgi:hypothetical protein
MISSIQNRTFGRGLRRVVCAALALVITGITTQEIVRSAGEHEYGIGASQLIASHPSPDISRRMTVAQAR